jgi:hypothetical protein
MAPRDPSAPASVPSATLETSAPRPWTPAVIPAGAAGHLPLALAFDDRASVAPESSPPYLHAAHLRC